MEYRKKEKLAKLIRYTARSVILVFGILVFLFALLSGSEGYGGGIRGIIKNSPNAIPWAILLVLVFVAWKWDLVGGILIILLGLLGLFYFVILSSMTHAAPLIICLINLFLGGLFILSWYLSRKKG